MIRATDKFKNIMNRYEKNNNKQLYFSKFKNSLNNLFINDLDEVKKFRNFSDEEYMINEIKNENKDKSEKKIKKFSDFHKFIKNERITKDIFFYYRNRIDSKKNKNLNKSNNINLNLLLTPMSTRLNSTKRSIKTISSVDTKKSKKNKLLMLPLIYSQNMNQILYKNNSKSYISDDDDTTIINIASPKSEKSEKNLHTEISIEINDDLNLNINEKKSKYNFFLKNN